MADNRPAAPPDERAAEFCLRQLAQGAQDLRAVRLGSRAYGERLRALRLALDALTNEHIRAAR